MSQQNNSPVAVFFYEMLLSFYPHDYRKEYGEEMRLLFHDLYKEEHDRHGEIGVGFWLRLIFDVLKSTFQEHVELLKRIGLEKYAREIYHLDRPFFVGAILLVPFMGISLIDMLNVILLANHSWLEALFTNSFWSYPFVLFTFIVFPIVSIVISIIYIVKTYKKENHRVVSFLFLAHQFPRFLVILVGVLSLLVVFGHDFLPCLLQRIFSMGILNTVNSISSCVKS